MILRPFAGERVCPPDGAVAVMRAYAARGAAAQAAVFPGAMCRRPLRTGRRGFTSADLMAPAYWPQVSRPPTAVGKKLSPQRGGRRASLKHRARNAGASGGVAFHCHYASASRGAVARGSERFVCANGVNLSAPGTRRSARPPSWRDRQDGLRRTRRRKEYGCISASICRPREGGDPVNAASCC